MNGLSLLSDRLRELASGPSPDKYLIPALWAADEGLDHVGLVEVHPREFFRDRIEAILAMPDESPAPLASGGEWSTDAVVYNMFVRLTAACDHNGDGEISLDDLDGGYRETGTFLKAIAMLPYLKRMGCNTVYLLPVTAIGQDGNKGSLGSPYAIKNPYKLDQRLSEPWLGLDVETEYAAFVEAAHRLGFRIVMEFVFRTASKDSEWIAEHPNWFYWIDASIPDRGSAPDAAAGYGNPTFSQEELQIITLRVKRNDTSSLPPPGREYRAYFTEPPAYVDLIDGRYIGTLFDDRKVRIPGAFADWPPDDVQPPWNDVTYLKMYDHPSFNYIAYNTIRVYDSRLAQIDNENRGLWNTIINIIPHYQKNFGIDGVMIDMGHALPRRLKQSIVDRARKLNPDFAFWEENFAISVKSRQEGYNAAVGYLLFDEHLPAKLREFFVTLATQDVPVPFFATAENHNTPRAASRAGGRAFSRMAAVLNAFLPAVYFVHQGFELGETSPVNTGLGFTPDEIATLPSHTLPLFSEGVLSWATTEHLAELISRVLTIRSRWHSVIVDPRKDCFHLHKAEPETTLCFSRSSVDRNHVLVVIANADCINPASMSVNIASGDSVTDALTGTTFPLVKGVLSATLEPGRVLVIELTQPPE
ncbi:MAG: alpha-amylase [Ignavibacteriae bacterium]|nr:alpha-amylase [Ignavibacteriota bacterium]